jgi:hypothetical protein
VLDPESLRSKDEDEHDFRRPSATSFLSTTFDHVLNILLSPLAAPRLSASIRGDVKSQGFARDMPKKRAPKKLPSSSPKKQAKLLYLIVIDQEPLRKRAATECSRALAQLEKARAEWRRFDREDRPAFERWMAATFGGMLTKIREVEGKVSEREMLIAQVEMEMMYGGRGGYAGAYERVMKHRAMPPTEPGFDDAPPPQEESGWSGENPDPWEEAEEIDPFEEELLFEEFLRVCLGINADRLSDREYYRMLKEFRENVLKKGKAGREQQAPPPPLPPHGSAPVGVKSEAGRIKEIYRLLVRRLHPDLRADKDAEVSHFWHDVQEAYGQANLERLEMLLALTDLQSNAAGDHTSLFQMRSVLAELRKAFRALQRSLGQAKKDPAWKFATAANRQQIRAGIQRNLERELSAHEAQLAAMDEQIGRWKAAAERSKAPKPKPKPAPQQKKPPQPTAPPRQKTPRRNDPTHRYTQTGFSF